MNQEAMAEKAMIKEAMNQVRTTKKGVRRQASFVAFEERRHGAALPCTAPALRSHLFDAESAPV